MEIVEVQVANVVGSLRKDACQWRVGNSRGMGMQKFNGRIETKQNFI